MNIETVQLSESTVTGSLGVMHLKRYWEKCQLQKSGKLDSNEWVNEWNIDTTLLAVLNLGLEQTLKHIYDFTDFGKFENWVLDTNSGQLAKDKIDKFNAYILNRSALQKDDEIE